MTNLADRTPDLRTTLRSRHEVDVTHDHAGCLTLLLQCDLDCEGAIDVARQIVDVLTLDASVHQITLDLARVQMIDMSGIAALESSRRRAASCGVEVRVQNVGAAVREQMLSAGISAS